MRKILFLADPNSIHDIKWISFFANENSDRCLLLPRLHHYRAYHKASADDRQAPGNFHILSPIHDFSIVRCYRTFYEAFLIKRIIRRNKISVVHILYAEPNALWCLFRSFFSVPIIISTRGTDVLKTIPSAVRRKDPLNRLVAYLYKRAFQNADWITATSQAQIASITRFSGREGRLSVVRTGVDTKRLVCDTSNHFPLADDRPFVLFPRFIKPIYNHEFCLAAIALLSPSVRQRYKMVFVGKNHGDNPYQKRIENLMQQQSGVVFEFIERQRQEAIFELYKRASLVVMTPVSDGSPVSGMEALLCGSRLILGPLDYDEEIFSLATKLEAWDSKELAQKMTWALENTTAKPGIPDDLRLTIERSHNMEEMRRIYNRLSE